MTIVKSRYDCPYCGNKIDSKHVLSKLIETLIKAVEEKIGEKIEFVDMHSKDIEEFTQILPKNKDSYTFELIKHEEPFYPKKRHCPKGHEKPYKFHK